ncbi:rhomboid family intramembrane serine protease [Jannaschia aquimarina]|uniref:Rhomboid family protein n=1 Tax=Jannaschia aquimarina TaxID=935700 RepID=A0A0D1D286_9RHOB|nr:rhomboid family intramembrane serine protease [Jannaschia aquimarina]KIT14233.1 Rhomboid family protein [Jannaschia aquimarina]SNS48814.1 Membrane associated serine protease, rhomboid family [Jannaschia aquimarina]
MAALGRFAWLVVLLSAIWVVQAVNWVTGYVLNGWLGLIPRTVAGLDGVLFMPLLHGSFSHAAANTGPLAVFGGLLTLTARAHIAPATAIVVALGGFAVWVLGGAAIHIGASGLIFGWFGYLLARGLVDRRPVPLLVTVGVALIYGTMLWGVLPGQPGVSWEAHLFGAVSGICAAFLLRGRLRAL